MTLPIDVRDRFANHLYKVINATTHEGLDSSPHWEYWIINRMGGPAQLSDIALSDRYDGAIRSKAAEIFVYHCAGKQGKKDRLNLVCSCPNPMVRLGAVAGYSRALNEGERGIRQQVKRFLTDDNYLVQYHADQVLKYAGHTETR